MNDTERTLSALAAAMPEWSWQADGTRAFAGARDEQRLHVEWRLHRATRVTELTAALSEMTLVLRHDLADRGAFPIALAIVPTLSDYTVQRVREFMSRFAPGMGWGIIGRDGHEVIVSAAVDVDWSRRGEGKLSGIRTPSRSVRPFTDLNRLMFKTMLLANSRVLHWGGPRCSLPSTARQLQRVAGVAYETARKFVRTFESLGFLQSGAQGLELIEVNEALEVLLHEERHTRPPEVPVRWLLGPPRDLGEELRRHTATASFAVGGWEACRLHEVLIRGHSYVSALHILEGRDDLCRSWKLRPCDPRDAQLVLIESTYPRSTLAGVTSIDGVPTVDILQAALDVASHADRGNEQIAHVVNRVLGFSIWKDDS